jgi:phosphoribosyl-ATP pyrophosphohydrolase/phosphoribosyl-AMP cyclohydrolase
MVEANIWFGDIKWNEQGLIPVVTQDVVSGTVLMLAYMNREALAITLTERQVCYYSRSRQELWRKGETSGHIQELVDWRLDCDKDSLLILVKQSGVACHEGEFSCFHYGEDARMREYLSPGIGGVLAELATLIASRHREMPEGAYTTYLFSEGLDKILKKVGEECTEVVIAAKNSDKSELRYETADLLYHLLVLLEAKGLDLSEVWAELRSRRKCYCPDSTK